MAYKMTPKRRAALKKAQAASARKRKGKGKGGKTGRRVAVVAATGGLALAAAGVAGAYYARKTAGGGPKAPKINHSRSMVPAMTRHNALRAVTSARWGGVPAGRRTMLPKAPSTVNLLQIGKAAPPIPIPDARPGMGKPVPLGRAGNSRRSAAEQKLARAAYGSSSPNRLIVANSGKRGGSRPIIRSRALWENRRDFYLR